eukprot:COSAG01_NODE_2228_length_8130_cov_11.575395_10_plen_93_part_00
MAPARAAPCRWWLGCASTAARPTALAAERRDQCTRTDAAAATHPVRGARAARPARGGVHPDRDGGAVAAPIRHTSSPEVKMPPHHPPAPHSA